MWHVCVMSTLTITAFSEMLVRLAPFLLWVATSAASQVSSPGDHNDEEAGLDDDDNDAHDKSDDGAHDKDEECS